MRKYFGYSLILLWIAAFMAGCGGTGTTNLDDEFPWSINVPELSVRLIVRDNGVELGQYPVCIMEVMNTSKQTVLIRRDFSLNGPAVYDKDGNPMPQRKALIVKSGEAEYYRIEPRQMVSVKAIPNYKIGDTGTYFLKFAIQPSWWGYENPQKPGKVIAKQEGSAVISNEVKILVYSRDR